MEKIKMYVSVVNQQVYSYPHDSPWEYQVEITREALPVFQHLFDETSDLEFRNFLRSHLPYLQYHYDRNNHHIDQRTMKVYAWIHEFTDEDSKRVIEQMHYFR